MGATILVVDDEPLLLFDLGEQLRAAGYTVIEAASGVAAQGTLGKGTPERPVLVDLVVTDVRMPGSLDGIELARWAKTECELPVILLSGEMTGRDLPDVADARLTKPVNIARLIETIERLMQGACVTGRRWPR